MLGWYQLAAGTPESAWSCEHPAWQDRGQAANWYSFDQTDISKWTCSWIWWSIHAISCHHIQSNVMTVVEDWRPGVVKSRQSFPLGWDSDRLCFFRIDLCGHSPLMMYCWSWIDIKSADLQHGTPWKPSSSPDTRPCRCFQYLQIHWVLILWACDLWQKLANSTEKQSCLTRLRHNYIDCITPYIMYCIWLVSLFGRRRSNWQAMKLNCLRPIHWSMGTLQRCHQMLRWEILRRCFNGLTTVATHTLLAVILKQFHFCHESQPLA